MADVSYRDVLQAIIDGNDLTQAQAHAIFSELMDGELAEAQIGALLIGLQTKGLAVPEIAGAARAMKEHAVPIDAGDRQVVDIVGTGGTGLSTFNISTTTCFVAAGAGLKVAKHGNVTNTRASGSANLLEALGVKLDAAPETVTRCIAEAGVGFCYARSCHPAMRFAAPVRKQLPVRTIFNILGPLTNPAGAKRMVMGVFADDWTETLAAVLAELGVEKAWVVCGGGQDELSTSAPTRVTELAGGTLRTFTVSPADAGLPVGEMDDLLVADPAASADRCRAILDGTETGPSLDIVLLNAAAALVVCDKADDLTAGVAMAKQSIDSGAAKGALETLIAITNG